MYLAELAELLAELFPKEPDQRRLADDAKVRVTRIRWADSPINVWRSVVDQAWMDGTLENLLEVTCSAAPAIARLGEIKDEHQKLMQRRQQQDRKPTAPAVRVSSQSESFWQRSVLAAMVVLVIAGGSAGLGYLLRGRETRSALLSPSATPTVTAAILPNTPLPPGVETAQAIERRATGALGSVPPALTSTSALSITVTVSPTPRASTSTPTATAAGQPTTYIFERELPVGGKGVAWSPDGTLVSIATQDGLVLYDTVTWAERRTLADGEYVYGALFSSDGELLVALTGNGLAAYRAPNWNEVPGLPDIEFRTSATSSYFADFSPDGGRLAVKVGETVKLYETTNWGEVGLINTGDVNALAFASDGEHIATADWSAGVRLWDIAAPEEGRAFGDLWLGANRVAFLPDGSGLLAVGLSQAPAILWNVNDGAELQMFEGHKDTVNSIEFSPDGRLLTASGDVTMRLWDVKTGTTLQILRGHTQAVIQAVFSPDGRKIASTSTDETTRIWTMPEAAVAATPNPLAYENGPTPTLIALSPAAIAPENATRVAVATVIPQSGKSVAWSPGMNLLALASADEVILYDPATWTPVDKLASHNYVYGVTFSPDGRLLVVLTMEGVRVFEAPNWPEIQRLPGTQFNSSATSRNSCAFSPDGGLLAVVVDQTVTLFETGRWREAGMIVTGDANAVAFSHDGKQLVTGGWSGGVKLWDVASGAQLQSFGKPGSSGSRLAYTPDGSGILGAGYPDPPATLWDVEGGTERQTFPGHTKGVAAVAFSRDGRLLMTASEDSTVRLWEVEGGSTLQTLSGHTKEVNDAALSPDGALIASTSLDGTTRIWSVQP